MLVPLISRESMNKSYRFILFIIPAICSQLLLSCKDNPVKPQREIEKAVIGNVRDQTGKVLESVDVHYIFSLGSDYLFRNATIEYSVLSMQSITVIIYDMLDNEIARPVDDLEQPPGHHTFFFNGENLTNGVYHYEVKGAGSIISQGSFLILDDNIPGLIQKPPLTLSGADGSFRPDREWRR